jgi:alkylation response protein AidB-like acyl-CoA dehydrogenase
LPSREGNRYVDVEGLFMQWTLSDEQQMFSETLRGWLERAATTESVRKWLDAEDPTAFEHAFADEGWSAVGFAEEIGGQGGDLLEIALTAEELARHAAPSGRWTATALAAAAVPELVGPALSGEQRIALAVDAGDVPGRRIACAASGTALSGTVRCVLGADRADRLVVPAIADGRPALFAVDATDPGVTLRACRLLDRSRTAADVELDGARGELLAVDAETALAQAALWSAVLAAADALGAMGRVLELSVDYAQQRQQFGRPIGAFQAVKHAAAQMLVDLEASRGIVYYAAASVAQRNPDRALHAAVAKAQVTALGVHSADSALTLHGAIGYTWEHDLHLYYKRLKLDEKLFGAPAMWNERIADQLQLVPADA